MKRFSITNSDSDVSNVSLISAAFALDKLGVTELEFDLIARLELLEEFSTGAFVVKRIE